MKTPTASESSRAPVSKWAMAIAVCLALAFLYVVRLAVIPFLAAATIAYLLEPINRWLSRRLGASRETAALATCVATLAVLSGAGYWIWTSLGGDVAATFRDAPQLLHQFFVGLFGGEETSLFGRRLDATAISQGIIDSVFAGPVTPRQVVEVTLHGFAAVTALILIVILVFFFLHAGPRLARGMLWLVPPEFRGEVLVVAAKIGPMLRRYVIGLLVIVAFATVVSWLAIRFALGLHYALMLGFLTGLLELLPVLGPMASAALVGLLSLKAHGVWAVAAFAAYVTGFRLLIDRLVGPLVLGRAVRLHPVVVIFAFLAGGLLLGVAGVILAVPVAAAGKIILEHYYSKCPRSDLSIAPRTGRSQ